MVRNRREVGKANEEKEIVKTWTNSTTVKGDLEPLTGLDETREVVQTLPEPHQEVVRTAEMGIARGFRAVLSSMASNHSKPSMPDDP